MARTADTPTPMPAEPAVLLTVPLHPVEKIAHKTKSAKNRSQDKSKNRPQDGFKNRPDIINPVRLLGVVDEASLKALLTAKRQTRWCSRVRLHGLLLLIDYICRNLKNNGGISISADLAHSFVSKIRKRDQPTTITEPLCPAFRDWHFAKNTSRRVCPYQNIGSLSLYRCLSEKAVNF